MQVEKGLPHDDAVETALFSLFEPLRLPRDLARLHSFQEYEEWNFEESEGSLL